MELCRHCGEPVEMRVGPTFGSWNWVKIAPRKVHSPDGNPDCKTGL